MIMPAITGILEALYSRRDRNGNCYWALRFTDCESGRTVCGTVCGGESNINAIRQHWGKEGDWDGSIIFRVTDMGYREFRRLTKDWPHAGCRPEDLASFIRAHLIAAPST